jgi:hypothetical protein
MIEKNEILQLAKNLDLNADTVEKDYVLGWMLHGISEHLDVDFLLRSMREVADSLYEETGIEFSQDQFRFKIQFQRLLMCLLLICLTPKSIQLRLAQVEPFLCRQ